MGNAAAKLNHSRWYKRNQRRLLCMGLDGAGKNTLVGYLRAHFKLVQKPLPDVGIFKFQVEKMVVTVHKLQGESQGVFYWRHHFHESQGVLFLIDLSDSVRFAQSRALVQELLDDPLLAKAPFLILGNKADKPNEVQDLRAALQLERYSEERCKVAKVSVERGEGVEEALQWLLAAAPPAED